MVEIKEIEKLIENVIEQIRKRFTNDNSQFIFLWNDNHSEELIKNKNVIYILWSEDKNYDNYAWSLISPKETPNEPNRICLKKYMFIEFWHHSGKIAELFFPKLYFTNFEKAVNYVFSVFLYDVVLHEILECYYKKNNVHLDHDTEFRNKVRYYRENIEEKISN